MPSLRLICVNTASLSTDLHGVARLIEDQHPDIACVHGAPSLLRWRSISAALAREADLVVVGGGRTGGGNLLLSTLGVNVDGTADTTFAGHRGVRPPGATAAALSRLGSPFMLAGARLVGSPVARMRQVDELVAAAGAVVPADLPAVFCVDGVQPGRSDWDALARDRTALPGGVFVDERISVVGSAEIDGGVRVELTLPDAG